MSSLRNHRIIDFAEQGASLRTRYEQLIIRRDEQPDISTPLDEIAVLILSHPRVTCSQSVLQGIMRHGGSIVVCDQSMMPSGLMLPLAANSLHTQRVRSQIGVSLPRRKRVWQLIVQAKIRSQASVLRLRCGDDAGLESLASKVRSGDPENLEARAAQRYWPRVFEDPDFRRRRDAADQNRLLNYGYAVLRAGVARAICSTGLHPSIGVHHKSRSNPFCLADDLMEPWRAMVDAEVAEMVGEFGPDVGLDSDSRARLIGILHERLIDDGESRTVLDWISRSASSLASAICGDAPVGQITVFFPAGLQH